MWEDPSQNHTFSGPPSSLAMFPSPSVCDSQTHVCGFSTGLPDPCNHGGEFCDITRPPPSSPSSVTYGPPLTHRILPLATTYLKANLSTS